MELNIDGNTKQTTVYSWKTGTINKTGTTAGTNITSITAFANLFAPFSDSTSVSGVTKTRKPTKIKVTASAAAYIKINGGDVITLSATEGFEAEDLVISSLYVSDNGGSATLTVYLQ